MNVTLVPQSLVRSRAPLPARLMAMVLLDAPDSPKVHVARAVGVSEPTALRHWSAAVTLAEGARAEIEGHRREQAARVGVVLDALAGR